MTHLATESGSADCEVGVMTTSQPPDFHLNRPGVLIAALPAVLGFVPEKSLVLVTVDHGEMGCVMRVDLSDDLLHSLAHVADVAAAARPDSAIAVVIDEQGANCRMCNDEHRELADRLTTALADRGIELLAAHVVDRVAAGGRWHCADGYTEDMKYTTMHEGCRLPPNFQRPIGRATRRGPPTRRLRQPV